MRQPYGAMLGCYFYISKYKDTAYFYISNYKNQSFIYSFKYKSYLCSVIIIVRYYGYF